MLSTSSLARRAAIAAATLLLCLPPAAALAGTPLNGGPNPLPGSGFQGADGNMESPAAGEITDDPNDPIFFTPYTDWQDFIGQPGLTESPDPSGASDTWFFHGKEEEPGGWDFQRKEVTPDKSDVLGAWTTSTPGIDDVFLNLAFTRTSAGGTTFFNFELNQLATSWWNGNYNSYDSNGDGVVSTGPDGDKTIIPCRSNGDLIITFALQGNAGDVGVEVRKWTSIEAGPAECPEGKKGSFAQAALNANGQVDFNGELVTVAQGAMNAGTIQNLFTPAAGDTLEIDRFGEASLNLTKILESLGEDSCFSFGQISMHTRSSTPFTSDLKDFIGPKPIVARSCTISGTKYHDRNGDGQQGAGEEGLEGFRVYADLDHSNSFTAGDEATFTDADGEWTLADLPEGDYEIREDLTNASGGNTRASEGWSCTDPATSDSTAAQPYRSATTNCEFEVPLADGANVGGLKFGNWQQPTIEVRKSLSPTTDPGLFDLAVDGVTRKSAAGHGATTGALAVSAGGHTVAETGNGSTAIGDYDTSLTCTGKAGLPSGVTLTGTTRTSPSISVASGDQVVCTFTNTRRTGSIRVEKDVRPDGGESTDGGLFDINVDGGALEIDDGQDGSNATVTMQPKDDVAIVETAGTGTDLSKYTTSISCKNGPNGTPVVTPGTSATVDVESDDDWRCTVINERKTGRIVVTKEVEPADDAGRFDLRVGGQDVATNVGDGGSGQRDVQPGTYTVDEVGNQTDLADYRSTLECTKDNQPYIAAHLATSDQVTVDSDEVVRCTITNVRLGTIVVEKTTQPDADPVTEFDYDGNAALKAGSDLAAAFTLTDGGSKTIGSVVPNAGGADYVVSEADESGYFVASVSCDDGDSDGVRSQDRQTGEAQIQVSPGETVTCTFVNERYDLTVDVDKVGTDAVHHGDLATYTFTVTNNGNAAISDVDVTDDVLGTAIDSCDPQRDPSLGTDAGGDGVLDPSDVFVFVCTYEIADEHAAPGEQSTPAGVPDEILNKGTATGTSEEGGPVTSESNTHTTLVYHPAISVTKQVRVKGTTTWRDSVQVYVGDTVQFRVQATNTGDAPLDVDSIADVITGKAPAGACQLAGPAAGTTFAPGQTLTWTCEVAVTASVDDFTNTATIGGSHELPTSTVEVEDSDSATVDVWHPAIAIDKVGPAQVVAGQTISYGLVVTNPGDVAFAEDKVLVTDPRCDAAPVLVGKNGDPTPGTLNPGDAWSYTCSAATGQDDTAPVVNTGFVEGTDPNGRKVSDEDSVTTTLARLAVLGDSAASGPTQCVSRRFKVRVRGSHIRSATFLVDGKRVGRRRPADGEDQRVSITINPRKYSMRVHRIRVRVRYTAETGLSPKTMRLTFQRCARQKVKPQFTG